MSAAMPAQNNQARLITVAIEHRATDPQKLNPLVFHHCRHVYEYKVKTGDSIASLAKACGCSWQYLAQLNCGTDDPDKINWYLGHYFVCTQKSGANYIFTSADRPGILLLPRFSELASGLRVRTIRASRFPVARK